MSALVTNGDYRDEPWAKSAAGLPLPERMRRITACSVLLEGCDGLSDGLYSELVVMREVLQGDDLAYAGTYTNQETALKFLEDMNLWQQTMAAELEEIRRGVAGWPPESPNGDSAGNAPGAGTATAIRSE